MTRFPLKSSYYNINRQQITKVQGSFAYYQINVREYRPGNQKWTIQRKWENMAHKTKKNKTKTQHNMFWTPIYPNIHK